MGSVSEEVEQFFDTREDITSVSDSSSDCPEDIDCSDHRDVEFLPGGLGYKAWIDDGPLSIQQRRSRFLRWMGLTEKNVAEEGFGITPRDEVEVESDRITDQSGTVLGSTSSDEGRGSIGGAVDENFSCRIRNLDDGSEFVVDDFDRDGVLRRLRKVGSGNVLSFEEFERSLGMSPLVRRLMQKGVEGGEALDSDVVRKESKRRWLKTITAAACVVDRRLASGSVSCYGSYPYFRARARAVKVRGYKKRSKELSALYMLQDIRAHEGSILTMKFSPDGRYLASAGEDGIVRVWEVVERERSDEFNVCDTDPLYSYFKIDDFSEVVPVSVDSEKKGNLKASGKVSVVFPRKVFHISEEPIHEFRGHCGEILDLSWSNKKHLLSSSTDKTVRLWQVGCEHCLKVFSHNSYVTSIQFNPLDDNYFISGSIDGKVRIWEIQACQVVDWTDITEIVTAVCYRPDGKGGVVGSMNGDCRFYDLSDNRLQLYAEISLQGKKKSPLKRITGFQFSPTDQNNLMVTSADSQVRILRGTTVICKYRGLRNTGSQISATFTNDGAHVVSASEDSNVYVWNYRDDDANEATARQPRSHWSCERFFSDNCSVAVPWRGTTPESYFLPDGPKHSRFLSAANHISLGHGFFSESTSRGSATWPEEKLPSSESLVAPPPVKSRSQHKFFKLFGHSPGVGRPQASWGSVMVTAGWDGRIRSFQNYGLPV